MDQVSSILPVITTTTTTHTTATTTTTTTTTTKESREGFDWHAFVIGAVVFLVIFVIFTIIIWWFRWLYFSDVPLGFRTCTSEDYYQSPGEALANTDILASDILFVKKENDQDILFYKRVPKTKTCTPGNDQVVKVIYPQLCQFKTNDQNIEIGKLVNKADHNPDGAYQIINSDTIVTAGRNCQPSDSSIMGTPLPRWDPC